MRACTMVISALAIALTTMVGAQKVVAQQTGEEFEALSVRILPAEIAGPMYEVGVPDLGFNPAWEWQALVCRKKCTLEPVKLRMTPVQVQPYIGDPMPGHVYDIDGKMEAQPLVLMHGLPSDIRARPETWLHAGLENYPPSSTPGTLEIDIPLPRGELARIVPRFAGVVDDTHTFRFYLETKTSEKKARRQLLAELRINGLEGPASIARGIRLLRWAGDLDGDSKLDLILDLGSQQGTGATLFLSSAAKAGDMVGIAATFSYSPVGDPGC